MKFRIQAAVLLAACALGGAQAQDMQNPAMHMHMPMASAPLPAAPAPGSARQAVRFPPELKRRTLENMRMHLLGLAEIQLAVAEGHFDEAATIASARLGMASMREDEARQEARYMPAGMRQLGARMHRQAGEFALAAQDVAATGDTRKPQVLLGEMTQTCVACHATYRLR